MLTSSAYSMSLPAGTPVAIRVTRTGNPRSACASQLARCLTLKRRTSGQNHLVHFAMFRPAQQGSRAKLVRSNPMQGRKRPVQHVINSLVPAGPFHRGNARRLFHHTNQPLIARRAGAISAGVHVRHIVANGAQPQTRLQPPHRFSQSRRIVVARSQNVEGVSLSALRPHSRQLLQFLNQPRHRLGIPAHAIASLTLDPSPLDPGRSPRGARPCPSGLRPQSLGPLSPRSLYVNPGIFNPPSAPCTLD